MACRCARVWRKLMLGSLVVVLAVGYVLGVYNAPISQLMVDLAGSLGLASPAQNADAAYAAFQKGDYTTALQLARALAETGDAKAQSILGLMNYRGRGVPKDDHEAMKWFRRAADQGDASARAYLGVMFAEGRGVPQNSEEAAKWYRLAADQGDPMAQYNLGLAYATGEGVEQGNVSAHMWFNLAAARFPASDVRNRNAAVKNRDVVAGKMTPEQIAEAEALAREWRPK
jgi:hypothetical protein